jgi:hypothetical protein
MAILESRGTGILSPVLGVPTRTSVSSREETEPGSNKHEHVTGSIILPDLAHTEPWIGKFCRMGVVLTHHKMFTDKICCSW